MAQASIDLLTPTKSLIDLSSHSSGDFGIEDYELGFIFDDIVLVEYIDTADAGDVIMRNGLYIPTNTLNKAWRKAKVILVGPQVKYTKVSDIVIFPNNLGVTVSNIDISGHGKLTNAVFLNESRIFGICTPKQNGSIDSDSGESSPQ
jgi:cellobiose-specific phosphotransferase system component IIB